MAGPCFTLYYENSNFAPIEAVRNKLNDLILTRQTPHKYSRVREQDNGWELFLDMSLISMHPSSKKRKSKGLTGMILLSHSSQNEFEYISNAEKRSLTDNLGFVPQWSWTGCTMCKEDKDIDGLYFLLDFLINEFGGFQKLKRIKSSLQQTELNFMKNIRFRDYEAYFGKRNVSDEEKRQYEQYIPLTYYYMIDSSKTSFRNLDY